MVYDYKCIYKMNKKGALTDAIFVPAYILLLTITMFIGLYVWLQFQNGMTSTVANSPWISATHNATIINDMASITLSLQGMDYVVPLLVAGLLIVSLVFAFRTGASILYGFVSIILWGFALLMSAVYTNVFETFISSMPDIALQYPIATYLLLNVKWIVLGWLFVISVVMFTRTKREEQNLAAAELAYGIG
jgi:hypothetical protein